MSEEQETDSGQTWSITKVDEPLTSEEVRRLRRLLVEDAHATWLRKKIRVFTPWIIGVVGGLIAAYNAIAAHWKHS